MGAIAVVDDQRLFGAEAPGRSRGVHRSVATAIDNDASAEARHLARANAAEEAHCIKDAGGVACRDVDVLRDVRPDRRERRIKRTFGHFGGEVFDLVIEGDSDPHLLDPLNLLHQLGARHAIRGNAEMHHSAGERTGLADLDLVP